MDVARMRRRNMTTANLTPRSTSSSGGPSRCLNPVLNLHSQRGRNLASCTLLEASGTAWTIIIQWLNVEMSQRSTRSTCQTGRSSSTSPTAPADHRGRVSGSRGSLGSDSCAVVHLACWLKPVAAWSSLDRSTSSSGSPQTTCLNDPRHLYWTRRSDSHRRTEPSRTEPRRLLRSPFRRHLIRCWKRRCMRLMQSKDLSNPYRNSLNDAPDLLLTRGRPNVAHNTST